VQAPRVGITMNHGLAIGNRNETLITATLDSLKTIYEGSLENLLRS
jgi:hypothetical protein